MDITAILLLVGFLLMSGGTLVLLVRSFQESVIWGLASLFIPFANVLFALCHWDRAKGSFICTILGTGMVIGGALQLDAKSGGIVMGTFKAALGGASASTEELTASIQNSRNRIETLEAQFASQGTELTKQYAALEARRAKLKTDDKSEVERFNVEAVSYQAQNTAHKTLAQELETARTQLKTLLDQRSRLQELEKPASTRSSGSSGVIMYTTQSCPACTAAKSYFARKGISYDERDVNRSPAALQEFRQLGGRGVPLILVGSERMEGFNPGRLDKLF